MSASVNLSGTHPQVLGKDLHRERPVTIDRWFGSWFDGATALYSVVKCLCCRGHGNRQGLGSISKEALELSPTSRRRDGSSK